MRKSQRHTPAERSLKRGKWYGAMPYFAKWGKFYGKDPLREFFRRWDGTITYVESVRFITTPDLVL